MKRKISIAIKVIAALIVLWVLAGIIMLALTFAPANSKIKKVILPNLSEYTVQKHFGKVCIFMFDEKYYPFEAVRLPYAFSALEPQISECTMLFHYNAHYLPALEKLNGIVRATPVLQNAPLASLAKQENAEARRAAEIVFAHELHFLSLTDKETSPSEETQRKIEYSFGTRDNLLKAAKEAADSLYGSGFLWIAEDSSGRLLPLITKEHELPPRELSPVYALDLWEHAFYADTPASRSDYISSALSRINWDGIEKNLK